MGDFGCYFNFKFRFGFIVKLVQSKNILERNNNLCKYEFK